MAAAGKKEHSVLFICLGNICRSPMAEAVFQHYAKQDGVIDKWHIDSAAIGPWHVGGGPDRRCMNILKREGIDYKHKVRQLTPKDFTTFDVIFGMDEDNISDLEDMAPNGATAKLELLGQYDPQKELTIRDPYYGDVEDFETVYKQVIRCCRGFLDSKSK